MFLVYCPAFNTYHEMHEDILKISINGLIQHYAHRRLVFSILVDPPIDNPIIKYVGRNFFCHKGKLFSNVHDYCECLDVDDDMKVMLILKHSHR
jgi:hypothetical protein